MQSVRLVSVFASLTVITLALLVKTVLALQVASPWQANTTFPPQVGSWVCDYAKKDIVRIGGTGLVKIVLTLGNSSFNGKCSIAIFDSELRPVPYYIDYCNSDRVVIWVNADTEILHVSYGGEAWSNGYITFGRVLNGFLITYFYDFHSISGWAVLNGTVRLLPWNNTLQSYGIVLSPGTAIFTMLHDLQRISRYVFHTWVWVSDSACLSIVLGYGIKPLDKYINVTVCKPGLHYVTINVTDRVVAKVDGTVIENVSNPYAGMLLWWIGYKTHGGSATIYKLYITPVHVVHVVQVVHVGLRPCVDYLVRTYTMNSTEVRINCTLSSGSWVRNYTTFNIVKVPTLVDTLLTCKLLDVPVLRYVTTPVHNITTSVNVPVWLFETYGRHVRMFVCELGTDCVVKCFRMCGIANITVEKPGTVAIRYVTKPSMVKVHGSEAYWRGNVLYLHVNKSTIVVDEYVLEVRYVDALGRPLVIPGQRVYIDGQAYPTPLYMYYIAGPTNVTAQEKVLGFVFRSWSDNVTSRSRVVDLRSDTVLVAVYRIPTRIVYDYYVTARKNRTVLVVEGRLVDFYACPVPNATIRITCNETGKTVKTGRDGRFSINMTLPTLDSGKILCILYYNGSSIYVQSSAEIVITKMAPVQVAWIIAFVLTVGGLVLYVLLRKREVTKH